MSCEVSTGRFTSKDIEIQWLPCGVEQVHIQILRFHADVAGGTFKLRVNGELTANITFSDTEATLTASIQSALDALSNLAPSAIVVSSPGAEQQLLTGAADFFYYITVEDDALTGNATVDPNVTTEVTQQGAVLVSLAAQAKSFNYEETVDTTEVTAISEFETTEIPTKSSMTFDISVYSAEEDWLWSFTAGQRGLIYVYPTGKVNNGSNRYFAFWGLVTKLSEDFPDHDVVEKSVSGVRQGAMVIPFNSLYQA